LPTIVWASSSLSSPAAKPAGTGSQNATLNVGLGRVLQDLNGFDLDIASYSNQSEIYDTLLTYDDKGATVPRLAESWTIAPDGASATIKLRQGATFQNGKPVNADAILANWS